MSPVPEPDATFESRLLAAEKRLNLPPAA